MKKETANKILEQSRLGYDAISKEFSQTRNYQWEEFGIADLFVKENDKLLDIGCGNGRFVVALKNNQIEYFGTDSSPRLIEIAKEKYPNKKFVEADALTQPFEDSFFDIIFSFAVLHHIPSKEYRNEFVKEAGRVLKKDGYFVFSVWNLWQKKYIYKILLGTLKKMVGLSELDAKDIFLGFNKHQNVRFLHAFTKRELKKLLKQNGFNLKEIRIDEKPSGQSNFLVIAQKTESRS